MSNPSIPNLCEESLSMSTDRLEIIERISVMRTQESTTYAIDDYLQNVSSTDSSSIDSACRCKMVQWCFALVDVLQLSRTTVLVAMNYLDRFLSSKSPRATQALSDRREFQLASMTALYIAIKISEPKIMDMVQLSALSRGRYQPNDFLAMESQMLCDLKWRVNGPTSSDFLVLFLDLLRPIMTRIPLKSIMGDATYQIELAASSYDVVTEHPSTIAVAALTNSLQKCYGTLTKRILQNIEYATGVDSTSSAITHTAQCLSHLQYHAPTLSMRVNPLTTENNDIVAADSTPGSKLTADSNVAAVRERNGHSPKTCVSS